MGVAIVKLIQVQGCVGIWVQVPGTCEVVKYVGDSEIRRIQ